MKPFAILTFVAAATVAAAQAPKPVKWSIEKAPATAQAGHTVVIRFAAHIDKGWHLYGLDQRNDGPIPMEISVAPASHFTLDAKKIEKPEPEQIKDENFGVVTYQHSGDVVFGLPVTVRSNAAAGPREIEVSARFQACSDKVCLRPTTVTEKTIITVSAARK